MLFVKNHLIISLFALFFLGSKLFLSNAFADPVFDIKAKGLDKSVTIAKTESFSLTLNLTAVTPTSQPADWWFVRQAASNPSGIFFYDPALQSWMPGVNTTFQGDLFNINSFAFVHPSGLAADTYTFYFGCDLNPNSFLDTGADQLFYDSVTVTVTDSGTSSWIFTQDSTSLGISGVSPEAVLLSDGSVRLYVTDIGMKLYTASDGLNFTQEAASLPQGSDPTLIKLSNGSYRMYYVDSLTQSISTATSSDGLTWMFESDTGISNTTGVQAWGVPDSVELPDGSIRLYWVDMTSGSAYEVIKSAVSSDGKTFTQESGFRTENGYVDSYVMIAETGNWVGLFATTPAPEKLPQKIYIGTSPDGLDWTIESSPIIFMAGGGNALDPTAVPLGNGSYRIYYSTTSGADPFSGFSLQSGILKPN